MHPPPRTFQDGPVERYNSSVRHRVHVVLISMCVLGSFVPSMSIALGCPQLPAPQVMLSQHSEADDSTCCGEDRSLDGHCTSCVKLRVIAQIKTSDAIGSAASSGSIFATNGWSAGVPSLIRAPAYLQDPRVRRHVLRI